MQGLCGGGKKKKQIYQKVIIPKGMVNPAETTIIEIPVKLQKQPVVVAKRKSLKQYSEEDDDYGHCEPTCSQRPMTAPPPEPPQCIIPTAPPLSPPPMTPRLPGCCQSSPGSYQGPPQFFPSAPPLPYPSAPPLPCPSAPPQPYPSAPPLSCPSAPPLPYPSAPPQLCPSAPPQPYPSAPPMMRRSVTGAPPGTNPNYYGQESPSLAETEMQELQALKQDLEEFQRARRKLLASTSNLASRGKATNDQGGGGRNMQCNQRMSSGQSSVRMQQCPNSAVPQQCAAMVLPPSQAMPHKQFAVSHTKMVRATAQKPPPQRSGEYTAKNFNGDQKYDTCGCLDK